MDGARLSLPVSWMLIVCGLGCALPRPSRDDRPAEPRETQAASAAKPPENSAERPPLRDTTAAEPSKPAAAPEAPKEIRTEALTEIVAELQKLGGLDPAAQQQLMEDLKETDPALWPQLLESFRASMAYRRRAMERAEAAVAAGATSPPFEKKTPIAEVSGSLVAEPQPRAVAAIAPVITPVADAPGSPNTAPPQSPVVQAVALTPVAPLQAPAADAPGSPATATQLSAATPPIADGDWQAHLSAAIDALEKQNESNPTSAAEISRHAALRMLYLVDGRRQDAMRPIAGIPPGQQDFWAKQLYGLAACLDCERNPDTSRRAAEAAVHLREAAAKLGELATLGVRSLAFCSEVSSYGVYKTFEKNEFQAGQEVLLYAELENFKSESTEKGHHTALRSSYQILDQHGARVSEQEFAVTEETCQNARRDFFIRYFVWMPKKIYGGKYTLQLTIEDTLSHKIGQSSIEFTIKE